MKISGLSECFDIAYENTTGEGNTKRLDAFISRLKTEIKNTSGIEIYEEDLRKKIIRIALSENSMDIIQDKERCRRTITKILEL